jgi:hypothetical protein
MLWPKPSTGSTNSRSSTGAGRYDPSKPLRAELNAFYAKAYVLSRDELRYMLDPSDVKGADYPSETFRVLKTNEIKKYGEYRAAILVLRAWDRMERGELTA